MALNIKDSETDRLARELAKVTGETITEALKKALVERLERTRPRRLSRLEELNQIALRCAALPDVDKRSPDEILGYDKDGLPT